MSRALPSLLVAALIGAALTGCAPRFEAATTPPPGYTGRLDSDQRTMLISRGVALAFTCSKNGPCRDARARSANSGVAEIRPAYLDRLEDAYLRGQAPATTFVVTGVAVGQTTIRVTSSDGDRRSR